MIDMAIRKYKPTTPGRRGASVSDFAEITRTDAGEVVGAPAARQGRPQRARPHHHPAQGRRAQARLPRDRLPAPRQGRRQRQGRAHRVRPEPHRQHRAAALPRRREALHHRAARISQGDSWSRARTPTSSRATTCRCATSRPVRWSTPWSSGPAAARRWPARPVSSIQLLGKEGTYAPLRMPTGEIRRVDVRCRATVGEVGNAEQANINWGKAGRMRWKGKRPTVRGVVMNPVDHPHGGGEGKTSGGRHPVSPWGKPEGRTRRRTRPATSSSSDAGAPARSAEQE